MKRYEMREESGASKIIEAQTAGYTAVINSMTAEGIRFWHDCQHTHPTEAAAVRCSTRFWRAMFGSRYDRRNTNFQLVVRMLGNL